MSDSVIHNLEALRALYPSVYANSLAKEVDHINPTYRQWLSQSRFFVIGSIGPKGLDCSPRGDVLGASFAIADNRTILIPDRRGNNRLDTLQNIIDDPRISLIFFVAGINETVRMRGRAAISVAPELLSQFDMDGTQPTVVIRFSIETVYFQCARALIRSSLWGDQPKPVDLPSAGDMVQSAIEGFDGADYDAVLPKRQRDTLY